MPDTTRRTTRQRYERRALACRRTITRHMRHGSVDATKFWVVELVRALRHVYSKDICRG